MVCFHTGCRYSERRASRVQPGAAGPAGPCACPPSVGAAAERAGPRRALPVASPEAGLEDAGRAARGAEPDSRSPYGGRAATHRSAKVPLDPSAALTTALALLTLLSACTVQGCWHCLAKTWRRCLPTIAALRNWTWAKTLVRPDLV